MYEAFYNLRTRPFDLTTDPGFFVPTASHNEALNNLHYAIASAKAVTLLVGEAGTGKTTVLRAALERQAGRTHCISLQNPKLTRSEFIQLLAAKFSLSPRAQSSKAELLIELDRLFAQRAAAEERTVLVMDEAQSLSAELLEELRLLTNIESGQWKPLLLLLAGQPELATRLNDPDWRHLKQRVALRCELRPLSLRETAVYVASRITAAGGAPGKLFTRDAVLLMHQFSRGIPRTINVIADNALLGAFAAAVPTVTSHIVLEVCKDFDLAAAAHASTPPPPAGGPMPRTSNSLTAFEQRVVDSAIPPVPAHAREQQKDAPASARPAEKDREQPAKERRIGAPLFGMFGANK